MVDESSDYTHSFFLKRKSDQIQKMLIWIRILSKKYNIEIKRIRLDNSGENRSLQKECDKANMGITFEFTASGTLQQNSVAESDRIPSTTPCADPPRDARDSGSAGSHSTHLETSSSDQPSMVTYMEPQTVPSYMSVKCTRQKLRMPNFTCATHA